MNEFYKIFEASMPCLSSCTVCAASLSSWRLTKLKLGVSPSHLPPPHLPHHHPLPGHPHHHQCLPPPPPAPPLPHSLTVQPSAADAPSLYTPLSFVSLLHHSLQTSAIEDQSLTAEFFAYRRTPGCDSSDNPLTWWRRNEKTFPTLARAAKRFLAIPASSAPSERAFSKINIVIDKRRASLLPENADKLCFLKHNCTLNL